MNLLARREQSFLELVQKLSDKFPDFDKSEVILPALEKLREEKLQSDERFVESYVRYRKTRGMGPLKIRIELEQKGVNSGLVLNELYSEENDWVEQCRALMLRKFPDGPSQTLEEKQKQYRFLNQRGFESDQIKLVIG
jgi:regulatory protein